VGLSVVMSKQEGVVVLGGLRQNRVFVSMSSIINPGLMVRVYVTTTQFDNGK
jgi:hypothetical protein